MRIPIRGFLLAAFGLAASVPAVASSSAVEYYHSGYDHYFVTAAASEIARLDAGTPAGWSRTGQSFGVLELGTAGAADVCRFWSGQTFAPRSSHFYTPFAAECASVKGNRDWQYEGEVFGMKLPDAAGNCAAGTRPLYRLFNNGKGGAPNHRYVISPTIRSAMLSQGWSAEGPGDGVMGCVSDPVGQEVIKGHVVDGTLEGALVCLDANRNGRCDTGEPQATTDGAGAYQLAIPAGAEMPLVAEVIAGRSRDSDESQPVDVSYRMSSPSRAYGTDINPFSTLVQLTGQNNYPLAEESVREILGLPPYFDLKLSAPAAAGSMKQGVAKWVVRALKANGLALDLSSRDALSTVVNSFSVALTDLPQLRIATENGAVIDSKEIYVNATYQLSNPVLAVPGSAVPVVTLNGKIRGRGHSTWGQPKNPYKVQFTNDASYAAITDVLGMKKQRNWALLADWFDRSLMRNKLALSLGSSSVFADGLKWTPVGQHIEVWLNDDYVGVYLLTEDIRIDPARLNLKKMSSSPAAGDVDGGYIAEVDIRLDCYKGDDLNLQLVTDHDVPICVDTPDESAITPAQLAYIKNLLGQVEADLYGSGRLDRINPVSFVDWYLLQEFFRNNDALFISSDYLWKDTAAAADPRDRVLNMGPIWDFDRSGGNVNYNDNWNIEGCWVSKGYLPNWFSKLFDNPDFVALTLARWKQKRPALEAFVNTSIDTFARRLKEGQQRNFQRWPIFDLELTNYYTFAGWGDEVAFLRQFLNQRLVWLDQAYESPEAFNALCK